MYAWTFRLPTTVPLQYTKQHIAQNTVSHNAIVHFSDK